MPDTFIPLSEVEWVLQMVCDRYKVMIPKFLADYNQWWGDWEKARFASMEKNLKKGDILFDIGTENGWVSAIYAQFVGGKNMCLFEPVPENWPNIKATWDANDLGMPAATCWALVGDSDITAIPFTEHWPETCNSMDLIANTKFRHIDENAHNTPQCSIDWFVWATCIKPKALTIDVEGAELLVLQGASHTLREIRPLVWVSLHEGYINRPGVHILDQDVMNFMNAMGYDDEFLGADHERHFLFRPL
jgi:FkbM family methyltransferase